MDFIGRCLDWDISELFDFGGQGKEFFDTETVFVWKVKGSTPDTESKPFSVDSPLAIQNIRPLDHPFRAFVYLLLRVVVVWELGLRVFVVRGGRFLFVDLFFVFFKPIQNIFLLIKGVRKGSV